MDSAAPNLFSILNVNIWDQKEDGITADRDNLSPIQTGSSDAQNKDYFLYLVSSKSSNSSRSKARQFSVGDSPVGWVDVRIFPNCHWAKSIPSCGSWKNDHAVKKIHSTKDHESLALKCSLPAAEQGDSVAGIRACTRTETDMETGTWFWHFTPRVGNCVQTWMRKSHSRLQQNISVGYT